MSPTDLLAITPSPMLSAIVWIGLAVAVLYLARASAHKIIQGICAAIHDALNLAAESFTRAAAAMHARSKEVLLAAGREASERAIEREFERVGASAQKDLAGFQELKRKLGDAIDRIESDHQQAAEVPPDPPGWVRAVDAVAKMDSRRDSTVGEILADIHGSLRKAQDKALGEYREANRKRHRHLCRMMPQWRRISRTLGVVDKQVTSLLGRSQAIDRHMAEYEEIVRGTDRAQQVLASSSIVQFFVSALVLAVAVGGAAINFSLIARPMAEMVGGTSFIGNFQTADIAALVIIMVEISMGLFLMESLRITRLFPVISALPDKLRLRMVGVTFAILLMLASVEAGLAYMREILLQDELATTALLRGGESVADNPYLWITTAAQMGMGFTLPFALVFVAIPLETFVHSLRTVLGLVTVGLLRVGGLVLRVLASLLTHAGTALTRLYDVPVFMPLWIEAKLRKDGTGNARDDALARVKT
jgi:hypothetical protein